MSDQSTARMLDMYMEEAEAPAFLSGFFQSPPKNFHNTEKVEIDIMRDDEDVAIVVQDLTGGARNNESSVYSNKAFTPPIFKEQGAIHAYNMINRAPGQDPFKDPNFGANALEESFRIFRKLERKIRRSIELMASQVLQTGVLTLTDDAGVTLYTLDFQPKTSHIHTVSTSWAADGTSGDPLADLEALAITVRQDGKKSPTKLIFGSTAWARAKKNAKFTGSFDKNVLNLGSLAPASRGQGATFQGRVWIGNYLFEMWTYDAVYKDPQTLDLTPYVGAERVIMLSDGGRLDLSYGAIPRIPGAPQSALSFLPSRMSNSDLGLDLTTNAWFSPDGEHLMVSAGTRPLTIPTAIDTFACLDITA